jgi:hypothetical protein
VVGFLVGGLGLLDLPAEALSLLDPLPGGDAKVPLNLCDGQVMAVTFSREAMELIKLLSKGGV